MNDARRNHQQAFHNPHPARAGIARLVAAFQKLARTLRGGDRSPANSRPRPELDVATLKRRGLMQGNRKANTADAYVRTHAILARGPQ